jgi:hypothetical protein
MAIVYADELPDMTSAERQAEIEIVIVVSQIICNIWIATISRLITVSVTHRCLAQVRVYRISSADPHRCTELF